MIATVFSVFQGRPAGQRARHDDLLRLDQVPQVRLVQQDDDAALQDANQGQVALTPINMSFPCDATRDLLLSPRS